MQQSRVGKKKPSRLSELTGNRLYLVIAGVIILLAVTGSVYGALALRNNLNAAAGADNQALSGTARPTLLLPIPLKYYPSRSV